MYMCIYICVSVYVFIYIYLLLGLEVREGAAIAAGHLKWVKMANIKYQYCSARIA